MTTHGQTSTLNVHIRCSSQKLRSVKLSGNDRSVVETPNKDSDQQIRIGKSVDDLIRDPCCVVCAVEASALDYLQVLSRPVVPHSHCPFQQQRSYQMQELQLYHKSDIYAVTEWFGPCCWSTYSLYVLQLPSQTAPKGVFMHFLALKDELSW